MKYTAYIVTSEGCTVGQTEVTANDEGDCISQVVAKYKYTSMGDGWYKTISGRMIEIQVK